MDAASYGPDMNPFGSRAPSPEATSAQLAAARSRSHSPTMPEDGGGGLHSMGSMERVSTNLSASAGNGNASPSKRISGRRIRLSLSNLVPGFGGHKSGSSRPASPTSDPMSLLGSDREFKDGRGRSPSLGDGQPPHRGDYHSNISPTSSRANLIASGMAGSPATAAQRRKFYGGLALSDEGWSASERSFSAEDDRISDRSGRNGHHHRMNGSNALQPMTKLKTNANATASYAHRRKTSRNGSSMDFGHGYQGSASNAMRPQMSQSDEDARSAGATSATKVGSDITAPTTGGKRPTVGGRQNSRRWPTILPRRKTNASETNVAGLSAPEEKQRSTSARSGPQSEDSAAEAAGVRGPEKVSLRRGGARPFTVGLLSRFPETSEVGEDELRARAERLADTERVIDEQYHKRFALREDLKRQNDRLERFMTTALAQAMAFIEVRGLLASELGADDNISLNLDVFLLRRDVPRENWRYAEAMAIRHRQALAEAEGFLSSARAGRAKWLEPVALENPSHEVELASKGSERLSQDWVRTRRKLEELGTLQDTLSKTMAELPYEDTQVKIDTPIPELGRNVDLARQLSSSGQTAIPYISHLPPWAREVLGPSIEYALELVGMIIRWFLYPLWRILPSPIQIVLAFIAVIIGSVLVLVFSLLYKYWAVSVAVGKFFARFYAIRITVLFALASLKGLGQGVRRYWRAITITCCMSLFWYLTTPEEEDL